MSCRLVFWLGIAIALLAVDNAAAQITLLYDVDFGRPPHVAGNPPTLGAGSAPRKVPTSIVFGDPTVVAAQGAMTEQPCAFGNGTTGYDQLEFAVDPSQASGFPLAYPVYFAEMDVLVEPVTASEVFKLLFDCPSVNNIEFYANGDIRLYPAGGTIGTFTPGVPVHLEVELNFTSTTLRVWLDGGLAYSGPFTGTYLRTFRFNLQGTNAGNQAALDDLRLYGGALPPETNLLYDVDYAWPPHQVGLPPVLGVGPSPRKVPTEIVFGDPTVRAALGALNEQPCCFGNGTTGYDQLKFYVSPNSPQGFPVDYEEYLLSVDVMIQSIATNDRFTIYFDSPTVHYVTFLDGGTIQANPGGGVVGSYSLGVPVNVIIAMDMINDTWSVLLNGAHVYTGPAAADYLASVRLSQAPGYAGTSIGTDDLYLWGIGLIGAAVEEPEPAGLRPVALQAFPNPAHDGAWIRWEAPQSGSVEVQIVSVDGRRVWSQEQPAAAGQLRWEGRDEHGVALPSGVYFVRVLSQGEEIGRQPLILRR
jgi:hypothetical protein